MRRTAIVIVLALATSLAGAQELYSPAALRALGLDNEQISRIAEISRDAATEIRVDQAELSVKKAELARLLLEEDPNRRQIERNLRDTAEIEVRIRMREIERELEIRDVVGTERWTRMMQAVRARRETASSGDPGEQVRERLAAIGRALEERQEQIQRSLGERGELADDEAIREQLEELRQGYLELQELIRERL